MQKRRLTIARLLGVILFCGIIFAGLRSGSTDWFKSIYSLTFLILVYAGIAARYRRAFWYGFAVAGWAYFVIGFGPWVGSSFPTGAHASMVWTGTRPPGEVNTELLSSLALDFVAGLMARQDSAVLESGLLIGPSLDQLRWENRDGIGHCVLTILFGFAGGWVARRLANEE